MNVTRFGAVLTLLLAFGAGAGSSSAADAKPGGPADDPLRPLDWLVGGTWLAEAKGADGRPLKVECRFRRASHGRFVRYEIAFKTEDGKTTPAYEGLYWWGPAKRSVVMLQIDSRGTPTESVVRFRDDGLEQDNTVTRPDGTTHRQRVKVTRNGRDAFTFTASVPEGDRWIEAATIKYARADAAEAPKGN